MSLVGRKTPREENPLRSEVPHPREHVDDHVRVLGKVQSGNLPAPPSGRRSCTQPVPSSSRPESPRNHTLAREPLERWFAVGGSRLIRALPPHGLRRLGRCRHAASSGGSRPGSPRRSLGANPRKYPPGPRSLRRTSHKHTWPQDGRLVFYGGVFSWVFSSSCFGRRTWEGEAGSWVLLATPPSSDHRAACPLEFRRAA